MQFVFGAVVFAAGVAVGVSITNGTFDRVMAQALPAEPEPKARPQ